MATAKKMVASDAPFQTELSDAAAIVQTTTGNRKKTIAHIAQIYAGDNSSINPSG